MSKKEKKQKGTVQSTKRADGTTEYYITKAPQKTVAGKIVIIILAAGLALGTILSLIFALAEL